MASNSNKCSQCEEHKKEKDLLLEHNNNNKIFKYKNYFHKDGATKSHDHRENMFEKIGDEKNKKKDITKNEDKKLDFKEYENRAEEIIFLKRKKRRILKKIIFKHKKLKTNLELFYKIIYKIIEELNIKDKLLIISKTNKNNSNLLCNICKEESKLTKEKKLLKISCLNDFKDLFNLIFNELEQEENKLNLIKISKIKYNQILSQKKNIIQIKNNNLEKEIKPYKKICFRCLGNYLLNTNGISLLWEKIRKDDEKSIPEPIKNFETISGLEDMIIYPNKNGSNNYNQNEDKGEKNKNNIKNNLGFNDMNELNNIFNDKKGKNIFDLILDGEEENEISDLEVISDENKEIKNKNNAENKKINENKNNKKIKKGKSKEKKVKFKKAILNINQTNKNNKNNIANKNNNEIKDKNLININIQNDINKFNEPTLMKKNNEQNQPLFYNTLNFNPSQNNIFYNNNQNMINNNLSGYISNNQNINKESFCDRLNNELSFLKNQLNLISNTKNNKIANNQNINSEQQILNSNNNLKENLLFFNNSMHIILNYMNDIGEMLDKYSCINENSLSLMDSIINGNVGADSIIKLTNNNNYFSQLLNYNYNIQKMNTELCDMINKHLNH